MGIRLFIGSLIALVAVTLSLGDTPLTGVAGDDFDLSWFTTDGGGVMRSTGGDFELSGTIGQPDAGVLTGGQFNLTSGFWFQIPLGDCNNDGIVGLTDHDDFVDCLTGPAGEIAAECDCFDVDGSGTGDLADFSENQRGFFGE